MDGGVILNQSILDAVNKNFESDTEIGMMIKCNEVPNLMGGIVPTDGRFIG